MFDQKLFDLTLATGSNGVIVDPAAKMASLLVFFGVEPAPPRRSQQMRQTSHKALLTSALLATTLACATGGTFGPAHQPAPVDNEARAGAAFMQGNLLELQGRLTEAAEAYEEAARLDPESAPLQRHLAQIWGRVGETERALGHAERIFPYYGLRR